MLYFGGGTEIGDDEDLKALPPATSAQASPGSELSTSCVRTCLFTLTGEEQKPVALDGTIVSLQLTAANHISADDFHLPCN